MKISVAMATYNGSDYIIEQLDSIKNQSYKIDEVVICDDQSSDNTVEIVKKYILDNALSNWSIEINEKNLGYADNFYKAMKLTTGDYIFLCDQDDIWVEDKIESMIAVMEKHSNIYVLGSDFEPYYCTEDAPQISSATMKTMKYNEELEQIKFTPHNIFIGSEGCTMCVRRSILDMSNKYWYSKWPHDEYLWKIALSLDGMYVYHKKTMLRRLHSNNASKRKMHTNDKRIAFLENLYESHLHTLEFAKDNNLENYKIELLEKNVKSVKLRIDMLKNGKLLNIFPLIIKYNSNYHSRKSIPVEFLMAIRKK